MKQILNLKISDNSRANVLALNMFTADILLSRGYANASLL